MTEESDYVQRYAGSVGLAIKNRTVLVEGTSDADLFRLASRLEREYSGASLIGDDLAVVAAGEGDAGGALGVVRELLYLRGQSRPCLLPNGRPRYRFIGLLDNDRAGRSAISTVRTIDASVREFKDIFRLWPIMVRPNMPEPGYLKAEFERSNTAYKGLDWEIEDLLVSRFVECFLEEHPGSVRTTRSAGGMVHREFTRDGKALLHRFVRTHAIREDLEPVIAVLKALRFYLGLKDTKC